MGSLAFLIIFQYHFFFSRSFATFFFYFHDFFEFFSISRFCMKHVFRFSGFFKIVVFAIFSFFFKMFSMSIVSFYLFFQTFFHDQLFQKAFLGIFENVSRFFFFFFFFFFNMFHHFPGSVFHFFHHFS